MKHPHGSKAKKKEHMMHPFYRSCGPLRAMQPPSPIAKRYVCSASIIYHEGFIGFVHDSHVMFLPNQKLQDPKGPFI